MNNRSDTVLDHSLGAYLIPSGMGSFYDFGGHRARLKVGAAATGGAFLLAEIEADHGGGMPPHIHSREDETYYILEGSFAFQIGDETVVAEAGDTVFAPRHVSHAWYCVSAGGGRATLLITPGASFQEYAGVMAEAGFNPRKSMAGEDASYFIRLSGRYGIEMLPHALGD